MLGSSGISTRLLQVSSTPRTEAQRTGSRRRFQGNSNSNRHDREPRLECIEHSGPELRTSRPKNAAYDPDTATAAGRVLFAQAGRVHWGDLMLQDHLHTSHGLHL